MANRQSALPGRRVRLPCRNKEADASLVNEYSSRRQPRRQAVGKSETADAQELDSSRIVDAAIESMGRDQVVGSMVAEPPPFSSGIGTGFIRGWAVGLAGIVVVRHRKSSRA